MSTNVSELDNTRLVGDTLTHAEIASVLHHLSVRKAYANKPEVKEARKRYARVRAERMKRAVRLYRQAMERGEV